MFSGIDSHVGNLSFLSDARSRSLSAENPRGEKGKGAMCELKDGISRNAARDLGKGWKVNPCARIKAHETFELANIEGPGAIQHIWITPSGKWRNQILRVYWDDQVQPSVESPVGDFFAAGWQNYIQISSLAVCTNPASGLNCYWSMPFRKSCRISLENRGDEDVTFFYQIDYTLTEVPGDCAYFHARWRRTNTLPYKSVYTILDGVKGKGQYVGTYLAWGTNNNGWWGEGEIKFYLDGDGEYPTICGTGTEDYFCGSYGFLDPYTNDRYVSYTTPYTGFHEIKRDELYNCQKRFGMYRWHITDPIRFEKDLKVTIQALGCREGGRYLPLQDDIASVAFWYQTLPAAPFPALPDKDYLEII
ncbi:MAG: DUF2961 domain-containing protein [Treponema sp.]|jgi:hypothetical protein|nr:DUF2961 domain-containing protein [Treponema sp.]